MSRSHQGAQQLLRPAIGEAFAERGVIRVPLLDADGRVRAIYSKSSLVHLTARESAAIE